MRRFLVSSFIFLFVTVFVFSGGQNQSQAKSSAAVDYGKRTSGPNYWMVKYDQPVTLHVVNYPDGSVNFPSGDDPSKNEWTRIIKRDLNIDIVTDWISPTTEYTTRLNLAIASGQLPDVFEANAVQFRQLVDANATADITDYIENNASDTIKSIFAFSPSILDTAKRNGRLVGIPQFGYGTIDKPMNIWLRHDWKEAAKISVPKTVSELENIMAVFMKNNPGTYGMPLNKNLDELYYMGPSFGVYPNTWITATDGSIVHGGIQPGMKAILTTFADWYRKGYIKKDFMSMDSDAVRQDLISGRFGVQILANWWGYANGTDIVNNLGKDAYFEAYELPSVDGKPPVHPLPFDNGGYNVINKNSKNIDAAVKCTSYILYIARDAITQKIITFKEADDILVKAGLHTLRMFRLNNPIDEISNYEEIQKAVKTGDTSVFTNTMSYTKYMSAHEWVTKGDATGVGNWLQGYADFCAYNSNIKVVNDNRFILNRLMGPVPEDVAVYGTTLDDMLKEGFIKIITGERPVSYFDELVNQWKNSGGDAQTRAMNREYN
ncbi:MAG: extracellular solute-binding protein [Treponema sp.]|jgi:putative aldouronate transport system substrate-binding protein|nr:extracellular solute-binding protein [Treponema sp.]